MKIANKKNKVYTVVHKVGVTLIGLLLTTIFFTSCPDNISDKQQKVKITVKAGAHVQVSSTAVIDTVKGTSWSSIKGKAESLITYDEDWEADGWKIGSESGETLTGSYVFTQDTTVFAIAKAGPPKIKLTIQGDSHVQGVPKTIKLPKGSAWKEVKAQAKNAIGFADGYTLKEWHKDSAGGELIADSFVLDNDTTVFAVSAKSVTITIKGDENVTGTPTTLIVSQGSLWGQIKNEALKKIGFKDKYTLASWHHNDGSGAVLQDADSFAADKTVFAKSKLKPVENISITIKGDSHVTVNTPTVQVGKESTWSEIKAVIEAAVTVNADYEIKEWHKNGASGAVIQDTDIFTEASTVYAVTKEKLTLTIKGDDHVTVGSPDYIKIKSGSKWQDIKAMVEAKIDFADGWELSKWHIGNASGEQLSDLYTFTENKTVYAVSKTDPTPKVKITVSAAAGAEVTIASPAAFKVNKGSSWADIKAKAEAKVTCNEGYAIKEWKKGDFAPLFDGYIFNSDEAVYVETEELKKVTFEVEGEGGTLTAKVEGMPETSTSPIYVLQGKTVTFTATPDEEWKVVKKWTIEGGSFEEGTGTAGSTTAKLKVTQDVTVKAHFGIREVAYTDLETFLTSGKLKDGIVNPIKITGTIPAEDFKGSGNNPGTLGKKIKKTNKKIALILPENINNVTSMYRCFYECTNLVSVKNLPQSVTNMSYCFYECTNLTQAPEIPNSVTDMSSCFSQCENLTQAPEIPNSVTDMGSCFAGCKNLTQAPSIPHGVTNMTSCFFGCTNLTQAPEIPNSVTNMNRCFSQCKNLTQAPEIPNSVTSMYECFYNCTNLTQAPEIPNSVTDMSGCFFRCENLTQAPVIPNSVTNMSSCFSRCENLTQAPEIPNSVTNMDSCFSDCENLTQAPEIPQSVTSMGSCFYRCKKLKTVKLHCPLPNNVSGTFEGCTSIIPGGIKVKNAYLAAYKAKADYMKTTADRFSGF